MTVLARLTVSVRSIEWTVSRKLKLLMCHGSWMHSLMLRAMTVVAQPALTQSCGGLTSDASGLTLLPESAIEKSSMMATCKLLQTGLCSCTGLNIVPQTAPMIVP